MNTSAKPEASTDASDPRFTMGLVIDVMAVLEKHGYVKPPGKAGITANADVLAGLLRLVREFEGRADQPTPPHTGE